MGSKEHAKRSRATPPAKLLPSFFLWAALASGCSYCSSRALDFTDIVAAGISTGGGVDVRALPTRLLSVEGGARHDERCYGWRRRHWRWQASSYGLFIVSAFTPHLGDGDPPPWGWGDICKTSHSVLTLLPPDASEARQLVPSEGPSVEAYVYRFFVLTQAENARLIDGFDIEVGVSALIGGLEVVVSPGELVDFLAGLLGLDPSGDDVKDGPEQPDDSEPEQELLRL